MESFTKSPTICILGAGFSGMCAGIKLQTDLDIYEYTIFDENHDVGGTWLTHIYPGCACDVASHLYSYSFELNPHWSKSYASQPEILAYLKRVALKYDLYTKTKFHHKVKSVTWDENISKWKIVVDDKLGGQTLEYQYDIFIGAIGGLRVPSIPEQFSTFKGPVIHSAKWDTGVSLEDKTVAVIGSGCSAVQIIPTIEPKVGRLLSFQRHPAWVVPLSLFHIISIMQWIFEKLPIFMWIYRAFIFFKQELYFAMFKSHSKLRKLVKWLAQLYLKWEIPNNPELREKLLPNYEFGCKRISPSNTYLKTLAKPKCEVIRESIMSVNDHSIVTKDGKEYPIDVLILATGYRVQDFFWPLKVYGLKSEDILESWKAHSPSHYLGIISSTSPNSFMLLGPNTAYGHNSVVFAIECQVNWIIQVLQEKIKRNAKIVSVKKSAEVEFMKELRERMKNTVWGSYECGSWYNNHLGINTTLYPGSLIDYWRRTRNPIWSDLDFK